MWSRAPAENLVVLKPTKMNEKIGNCHFFDSFPFFSAPFGLKIKYYNFKFFSVENMHG